MDILIEQIGDSLCVAALNDGKLDGIEVDPFHEEVRVGSIYWAKVARIDTSLDAAFVNLDGENIGLLNNADVRILQKDGTWEKGGDKAIGKVLTPGQMIAVQAKNSYLPKDPNDPEGTAGDKNPRVSMNITLPGRYLIFAPVEGENRISRRITEPKLRKQLRAMVDSLDHTKGCILRAAAANTQTDILIRESKILNEAWSQIQDFFAGDDPSLIMLGPDAVQRTLSDNSRNLIDHIEITTMDHFQEVEEWCEVYAPDLVTKIEPVELPKDVGELGLLELRDVVGQIEALLQSYVIMDKGASLIIEETAAMAVIDVNSSVDTRSRAAINEDAANEIARQLRLRNLGGIIMVDFLKMNKAADKTKLKKTLEQACSLDPCTVQIHGLTNLGLMEITRQRRTPPLVERFEGMIEHS